MDLRTYLAPLLKWWWLLVISTLLSTITCFLLVRNQPLVYDSKSTLLIGRTIYDLNPSNSELFMGQQLAYLYTDMARRDGVRKATMDALGINWLPTYRVNPLTNSQLIEIVVTDTNPERARLVADELANQMILLSPANLQNEDQNRQDFVQQQLDDLQVKIGDTEKEIAGKQDDLGALVSASDLASKQAEIEALHTKLSILQTNYATLLATTQNGATNILRIFEHASVPTRPVGLPKMLIVALAGLLGLVVAGGASYLLEFIDDTLKVPTDITRVTGFPLVGYIVKAGKFADGKVYVACEPRSPVAEGFRTLRANLALNGFSGGGKTILVTSPDPGDGKSFIVANLAASLAQSGKQVIVLDADLRRPHLHHFLGVANETGVQQVLDEKIDIFKVMIPGEGGIIGIVPAGSKPATLLDALDGPAVASLLAPLKEKADLVIVDGPPILVADAITLAANVDGVLLVTRPGYTRRESARLATDYLSKSGANVLGVVINCIPINEITFGYSYNYHTSTSYYYSNDGNGHHPKKRTSTDA